MKRFTITLAACAALSITTQALEITVTPGSLESSLMELKTTRDQTVVLKGEADSKDLDLLKHISKNVYTLDMQGLIIPDQTIPDYFLFDTNVSSVKFPEGIRKIGRSAFSATSARVLIIPSTVESIGDYAYADCKNLNVVSITGNAKLGKGIFKGCTKLDLVKFENAPSVIPESMFEDCTTLNFSIPAEVKELGNKSLRHTATKVANLQSVEKVGDYAFADCTKLETIEIDATSPIAFGKGVFFCDKVLTGIPSWEGNIPDLFAAHTVASMPEEINNPVIGEAALANNNNIDSITLGNSVKTIRAHAFRNTPNLVSVNVKKLGGNIPDLDPLAFSGHEDEDGRYPIDLKVEKGTTDLWKSHPVWSLFNINEWTGVDDAVADDAIISITRNGGDITASANMDITLFEVYSLNGMMLYSASPANDSATATGIPEDEVVVVRVKAGNTIKIAKLL